MLDFDVDDSKRAFLPLTLNLTFGIFLSLWTHWIASFFPSSFVLSRHCSRALNILRLYFSLPENIVLFFKLNFCFLFFLAWIVIHFCESIQEVHRKWPFIPCKRIFSHNYYLRTKCTLNLIFTLVFSAPSRTLRSLRVLFYSNI